MPDFLDQILGDGTNSLFQEDKEDVSDFPTLSHVLRFLREKGYKVKKSKLYQDKKKGLIEVRPDGSVSAKSALSYAAGLEKEGGDRSDVILENADRKFQAEIRKIEEQTRSIVLDREIKEKKYILRTDAVRQRVDQLSVIQVNLRSWIDRKADSWRGFSGSDKQFRDEIHLQLDSVFDGLARSESFRVEYFEEEEIYNDYATDD